MVAFTGKGLVSAGYTPKSNTTTRNFVNDNRDRAVEVVGYDIPNAKMFARELIKNKQGEESYIDLEVTIDPEAVERGKKNAAEKDLTNTIQFQGHSIDEKMASRLPANKNKKVVLEKAKQVRVQTVDGKKVYHLQAQRVINVPNEEPDRFFQGTFTVSANRDGTRVNSVQHWSDKAISVDDQENIDKLAAQMDEILSNYGEKMHDKPLILPTIGIQLRTIVPHKDEKNEEVAFMTVDTSGALDHVPAVKDESTGEYIKQAHPLDSETFRQYVEGYKEHIANNFAEEYPEYRIEITPYYNYKASPMSNTLVLKENKWDPISQMATCKTRLSQDEDRYVQGKNWAVRGIIQISGDREYRVTPRQIEFIPTYFVNKLHANNIKGHVQAWVRSSEGQKVVVHEKLQRIKDTPENTNKNSSSVSSDSTVSMQDNSTDHLDDPFETPHPKM